MSVIVLTAEEPCWVKLPGSVNSKLIDSIKFGVKPQTYRRYDPVSNSWYVHMTYIDFVVKVSSRYYDSVDYRQLPLDWQSLINEIPLIHSAAPLLDDDYRLLYITQDAPIEVIKASFKALAKKHHVDAGGSNDKMVSINLAYDRICKSRNI